MTQYGVKYFKVEDGVETEIKKDDFPDEYIAGLIKVLKDELVSRERLNRVFRKMADDILSKNQNGTFTP